MPKWASCPGHLGLAGWRGGSGERHHECQRGLAAVRQRSRLGQLRRQRIVSRSGLARQLKSAAHDAVESGQRRRAGPVRHAARQRLGSRHLDGGRRVHDAAFRDHEVRRRGHLHWQRAAGCEAAVLPSREFSCMRRSESSARTHAVGRPASAAASRSMAGVRRHSRLGRTSMAR